MLEYMYRTRVSLRPVFSSVKLYFSLFIYLKKDPVDPGLRFGLSRGMVYLSDTRFREILYNALNFFFYEKFGEIPVQTFCHTEQNYASFERNNIIISPIKCLY